MSLYRVLNKEHFYGKNNAENMHQKLVLDSFLILANNPKQPLHARNSFKNKYLCKPSHDITNYSASIYPFESRKCEKVQEIEYLSNEKSFLDVIKKHFV